MCLMHFRELTLFYNVLYSCNTIAVYSESLQYPNNMPLSCVLLSHSEPAGLALYNGWPRMDSLPEERGELYTPSLPNTALRLGPG